MPKSNSILLKCTSCETKFNKTPSELSKSGNNFCSRHCAAIYNNQHYPKKKRQFLKYCFNCTICLIEFETHNKKQKKCKACIDNFFIKTDISLKEYFDRPALKDKHPSWRNVHIRQHGRYQHKQLLKNPCANCGFVPHVELCHIKPLSHFDESSLLSEVNHISNVVQLCPNCHWLLDNQLLPLYPLS